MPDDADRREGRGLPASELRTMQRGNLPEREEIYRRRLPDAERGGRPLREKPAKRRPDDAEREGRRTPRGTGTVRMMQLREREREGIAGDGLRTPRGTGKLTEEKFQRERERGGSALEGK
jgi:hypothetical protein